MSDKKITLSNLFQVLGSVEEVKALYEVLTKSVKGGTDNSN